MPYGLWLMITMLSVRCEILVTTESKLAAVSPVPGAGDDSRGTVQGYSHKNPEQNQITPTLHHWAGMAHLCLTFHFWHCYVPHFCLNYTCNVCHDTKDLVFPQQYLLSSMINWSPWHWHLLHLSDHNHVIHVSQVNQTSTIRNIKSNQALKTHASD